MTAPVLDTHAACEQNAELYGAEFCLATRKPGPCKGTHRPGTATPPPKPVKQIAVPNAPTAKTPQQLIAERQAANTYTQAYLHAQALATTAGVSGQRHAGVQAAVADYARALHRHGQAIAADDRARAHAQRAHDSAVARNKAYAASAAAAQARAAAHVHARAAHAKLKKAVHVAQFPLTYPAPAGFASTGWANVADLYALPGAMFEELYALTAAAHWMCGVDQFCRNPLHPGPCKGWKHTLHAVAPGAFHAYEKARVEKANQRRQAKIDALTKLGQPVPRHLAKPITYAVPKSPQPGFTPPTPTGARAALPATAKDIAGKIAQRHAGIADAKLAAQAQSMHDVVVGIQGHTGVSPDRLKSGFEKIKASQAVGENITAHPQIKSSIDKLVTQVDQKVGGLPAPERVKLADDIAAHIEAGTPGVPQSVKDTLAKVSAPSVAAGPTPSAPLPAGTAAHVQHAVAVAHRSAPKASMAKTHMDAYSKLSKEEFDKLPADTQGKIKADLWAARQKFLDPKKRVEIDKTVNRLDPQAAHPPTPAVSAPPAVGKGYSDKVKQAVEQARIGSAGDVVTHVSGLDRSALAQMDPADRAKVLDRVATIGRLNGGVTSDRARELHRIATATSVPSETSRKWDHEPSLGELATEEAKTNNASVFPELDKLKAQTDPVQISREYYATRYAAVTPEQKAALEKHRAALEADASQPLWLRARMASEAPGHIASLRGNNNALQAIHVASETPGSSGKWYPTIYAMQDLYSVDGAELAKLPPVLREAIEERRSEGVVSLLGAGNQAGTVGVIFGSMGSGSGLDINTDRYARLSPSAQSGLRKAVRDLRDSKSGIDASRYQAVLDKIDGTSYNSAQRAAIDTTHEVYAGHPARMGVYEKLSTTDLRALPSVHQQAIREQVKNASLHADRATRREARHQLARWDGTMPAYSSPSLREAVLSATIDKSDTEPADRAVNYRLVSKSAWTNTLDVGDRQEILADMQNLADGVGPTVSVDDRYTLQRRIDVLTDQGQSRHAHVLNVINAIDPLNPASPSSKAQEFDRLSAADYASLPKAYAGLVDRDLAALASTNAPAYTALMARFHPGWTPPHAPTPAITKTSAPNIQAALDTIYGLHPKAHTTAHQLAAYGGLKTADFHQLNPAEQSTLLGDLSYIKTTAKGANATKADRLIGYFTPPGTPLGTIPNQPVNVPASAVSGQSRVADPLGAPGLMKQATDKGVSGDGWTRKTDGTTGPWGKHGAAGVMLRHIGSDGQARYLMIERGPGISDPGKWQFPGGAIDSKETPHQGATRETIEELGFKANDLDSARVHGEHVFSVHGVVGPPGGEWKYTTIAATVPNQLAPDLSTHHARAETSDAKWMTADEIKQLDKKGKLLSPLAGGKLEQNVMSLFPAANTGPVAPGPVTKKLPRLSVPKPVAHKPSKGVNLLTDKAAIDKLRQDVKQARKNFSGKVYDDRLGAIMAMQGFDDVPTVATKAEIDRLLATGDYIEVWRGVNGGGGKSAARINEEFRSGPAWNGRGVFGNGYYFATDKNVVRSYSDGTKNSVMRALIPKTALVDTHEKLAKEAERIAKPQSQAKGGRYEVGTLYDPGRYAAAKGLDGIRIDPVGYHGARGVSSHHVAKPGKPAYNWLNRSVMIVQEAE